MERMNEKIYAKAQRSFDHDNLRRSKKSLAFAVEKSLFTEFEAGKMVRKATAEEIAEAKAAEGGMTTGPVSGESGGEGTGEGTDEGLSPPVLTGEQFVEGTAPVVLARIDGASAELLQAALEAETAKGEKARKGVTDALTAALAPAGD